MVKLKNPLLSLGASNSLSKAISFVRRRSQNIAEEYPLPKDVQSSAQLSWRHMYQKCAVLWHALSAAEQAEWNSLGGIKHMTGFAYWQSQCLRPNPGIYLPLQGGTMAGDIEMNKNRILELPLPVDSQEALTLAFYTAMIEPQLLNEGAHVTHLADQSIADATLTVLSFTTERYDTDNIHSVIANTGRLTCRTAGKYLIIGHIAWETNAVNRRSIFIRLNGATFIGNHSDDARSAGITYSHMQTIYDLIVGDYVECVVSQDSGGPLLCSTLNNYSPEFMMQRIGA